MKMTRKTVAEIASVIKARLKLQSTRRKMVEEFGLEFEDMESLNSTEFFGVYNLWTPDKQKDFLVALGGRTNLRETKELVEGV